MVDMIVSRAHSLKDCRTMDEIAQMRGKRKITLVPYAYLTPTLVFMVVLLFIPVIIVVSYSFMNRVITAPDSTLVGFKNYHEVLLNPTFHVALKNTLFFTVISVIAHMLIGLGFALLLNTQYFGRITKAIFRTIFVLPWLLTVAIIAVLWRLLLNPNGVINYLLNVLGLVQGHPEWLSNPDVALWVVTFINIWAGYPFFMISLLAGLQGIPRDLYEAVAVDGAGKIRSFFAITVPQLRPIIISMALLDLIWTSQQFALIWMTTGGGPMNRTEMLATFTYKLAFSNYDFSGAAASAVIILALSMILAFFYVRYQHAAE